MIVYFVPDNKSYYSVDWAKRPYPKAGINIIKSYDGTTKKVFIK